MEKQDKLSVQVRTYWRQIICDSLSTVTKASDLMPRIREGCFWLCIIAVLSGAGSFAFIQSTTLDLFSSVAIAAFLTVVIPLPVFLTISLFWNLLYQPVKLHKEQSETISQLENSAKSLKDSIKIEEDEKRYGKIIEMLDLIRNNETDIDEKWEWIGKIEEIDPDYKFERWVSTVCWELWTHTVNAARNESEKEKAKPYLQKAIEIYPENKNYRKRWREYYNSEPPILKRENQQ